jgi:AraC-like DNA-binding protein
MPKDVMTSAVVIQTLLKCLHDHGISSDEVGRKTGIQLSVLNDPDYLVPLSCLMTLWELAVKVTGDPALALHIRESYGSNMLHFVGYIAINSANSIESLKNFIRYSSLICEAHHFELGVSEDLVSITYSNTSPEHQNPWMPEHNLSSLVYFSRLLIHKSMYPEIVHFQHQCQGDPQVYQDFFCSPVIFEQSENRIEFRKKLLLEPLGSADPHLQAVLKEKAEKALSLKMEGKQMSVRVQRHIARHLFTGNLSLESTAEELNISRSSLYRALKTEGTSFKLLLQNTRKALVETCLKQEMKASQIAYLTGYSDISSFLNASKSWFGEPLSAHRKKLTVTS